MKGIEKYSDNKISSNTILASLKEYQFAEFTLSYSYPQLTYSSTWAENAITLNEKMITQTY